ncbi:follicle stimulating hormone beta subunit precursor [Gasterosteus aculeatus]|uniref:Follicle stimulating hormone beta subunit n=1 Tax=Gasterosteus aculeatus TaxID=69293 RepID=Q8AWC5_GASAC|nr:follicle stimulating hormone beta subunit precursor [Gasterosteus aculeatus]CAD59058.1 follicle stimulating hormone beta subunit [Gasterosteus aculeatus]
MQLVVMAAMLALAAAEEDCRSGCQENSFSIEVEVCGQNTSIHTTICSGWCETKAPVYSSHQPPPDQNTCNGDWSYEVTHIDGCPEAVTYPVARDCKCQVCNPEEPSMHCGYHPVYNPSCPSM